MKINFLSFQLNYLDAQKLILIEMYLPPSYVYTSVQSYLLSLWEDDMVELARECSYAEAECFIDELLLLLYKVECVRLVPSVCETCCTEGGTTVRSVSPQNMYWQKT